MSGCIGYCQDVIDPMLQDVINEKDKEMIEINIIFKSQIDVEKLNERGANINDKRLRRSILIDELKFFSEEKQQDVMSILLAEEKNSNVSKIRSHWLSNAISCNASRDVIYLLAKFLRNQILHSLNHKVVVATRNGMFSFELGFEQAYDGCSVCLEEGVGCYGRTKQSVVVAQNEMFAQLRDFVDATLNGSAIENG